MRRYHNNKNTILAISVLLILFVGVGYAFITTKLNITGSAITKANSWDIHFDNVQVSSGSVSATAPTINAAKDTVTASVTLVEPGDYYTFTVDVVNAGTIDAMVDTITNVSLTDEQKKFITFEATYYDGLKIAKYDFLGAGSQDTIEITVKYRNDDEMNVKDIPSSDQTVNITYSITYVQATKDALAVRPVLGKEAFHTFASTNTPTAIIFTNTGSTTGTDISEAQDGSILAWMDSTKMYISVKKANRDVYAPVDSSSLFSSGFGGSGWSASIDNIDLTYLNTSNVTNMSKMFYFCFAMGAIDLSNFDTSSVTDMNYMFADCDSLDELDLTSFNTENVLNMSSMFYNCSSLITLDLSDFDTSKVSSMGNMFSLCSRITTLDLSNFDTSNVTDMWGMFACDFALPILDLTSFDTSSVTTMGQMFYGCESLDSLDISSFDTSKVTSMVQMFSKCGLYSIDLSNFDTSSVDQMYQMFEDCTNLTSVNVSSFDTSEVFDMNHMFNNCSSLTTLDISNFDTSNIGCSIDDEGNFVSNYLSGFLDGCTSLTSLTIAATNGNGISNTIDRLYGDTVLSMDNYYTLTMTGRTVTLA